MAADPVVNLAAGGDVMLGDSSHFIGRGVGSHVRHFGPDYPFRKLRPIIADADIFIANLESPLSARAGRDSWGRVYRGPAEAANGLNLASRNIVTIANNHILEHGLEGLEETRVILDAAGIQYAGFGDLGRNGQNVLRWEHDGLSLALFCVSLVKDISSRPFDPEASKAWILNALGADCSNIKIVSIHWGDEYVKMPSPVQRRFGLELVARGATLVLGHHPHVLQPIEQVGTSLIAYSLGNLVFDQDWTPETKQGGILQVQLGKSGVRKWSFFPTENDHKCQARPAGRRAARLIEDTIRQNPACEMEEYERRLKKSALRHRLRMKAELVRNFHRVTWDTVHFLATKRRRPSPRMPGA